MDYKIPLLSSVLNLNLFLASTRNNMELRIAFWRLEADRIARRQLVTTFLTTTFEDVSTVCSR